MKETPIRAELRRLRVICRETPEDMAKKLGISRQFLNLVESGKKKVSAKVIRNLIEQYDLTEDEVTAVREACWASSDRCMLDISHLSYEDRMKLKRTVK